MATKNSNTTAAGVQDSEKKLHEKVKIKIRKDRNSKLPDLFVGVNGKTWLIKRGEEVEVPRYVAEVIKNAEEQEERAVDFCDVLTEKFEKETKVVAGE